VRIQGVAERAACAAAGFAGQLPPGGQRGVPCGRQESMFFFEKKNQKTLGLWRTWAGDRPHQRPKVFCFFSSEKKTFSCLPYGLLLYQSVAQHTLRIG
jgi:hypothetical protein